MMTFLDDVRIQTSWPRGSYSTGAPTQRRKAAREVERIEKVHNLPARLGHRCPGYQRARRITLNPFTLGIPSITTRHETGQDKSSHLGLNWAQAWKTIAAIRS